ncbi:MAG: VapC toxin family PIN domain ribonuclease [Desulfobacterales bacterium CG23_combo_of_CG06-09_8_20_14_all_51_8]|nr:MAG: VapC toxin family PIN domain ribonuclease [Desulfobacterales bacterium CG23_combo_of_CG06-09_8_20_14_all_51_8]
MDKRFVIDNSVVMAWCFEDETSPYADFVLDSLKNMTAIVPSIWPLEVGNVLTVAERKKRLNEAASNKFIALLSELPIIVDQEPPERMLREILSLARKNQLSTYDASYLDLAMKRALPIATLDDRLIAAARQNDVRVMAVNLDL